MPKRTGSATPSGQGTKRKRSSHDANNTFTITDKALIDHCEEKFKDQMEEHLREKRENDSKSATTNAAFYRVLEHRLQTFVERVMDAVRDHAVENPADDDLGRDDDEAVKSELEDEVDHLQEQVDELEGKIKAARKNVPKMIRKQGENAIAERKKQLLESVNQDKENQEKDVEEEVSRVEKDLRAEWNKQISAVAEFKKTAKESSKKFNQVGSKLRKQLEQSRKTLHVFENKATASTPRVEKALRKR